MMIEILTAIGTSTALSSMITYLATRKIKNIDISQKVINFWEQKADRYLEEIKKLEQRVTALEKTSCKKENCRNRI
jgi:cob(I)alamin adenosyltransferase